MHPEPGQSPFADDMQSHIAHLALGQSPEVFLQKCPRARRAWAQAIETDTHACFLAARRLGLGIDGAPDLDRAARLLQQAAATHHAPAMASLSLCYKQGWGVAVDLGHADQLLRAAAVQGHAHAQNNLRASYANRQGVPQDHAQAATGLDAAGVWPLRQRLASEVAARIEGQKRGTRYVANRVSP